MGSVSRRTCATVLFLIAACSGGDGPIDPDQGGDGAKAAAVAVQSGDGQAAIAGTKLISPLVVKVTNSRGKAVQGVTVSWAVASGGGSLSAATTTTDAAGLASTEWTVGGAVGEQSVTASAGTLATILKSSVSAGAPAKFEKEDGDNQAATVAAALAKPLVVKIVDAFGNPVSGVTVTWAVTGGGRFPVESHEPHGWPGARAG